MNCRDTESLLLAEKDGVLTSDQHASLEQHVAACSSCQQLRTRLATALTALRDDAAHVPIPDIDAEWIRLQARIGESAAPAKKKRPLAPVIRFGAPLAAAAAVAFAFFTQSPLSSPQNPVPGSEAPADVASADFVESGNADASTMVYVDKESGWLVVWATDGDADHSS